LRLVIEHVHVRQGFRFAWQIDQWLGEMGVRHVAGILEVNGFMICFTDIAKPNCLWTKECSTQITQNRTNIGRRDDRVPPPTNV
jgi:hypothetical protein